MSKEYSIFKSGSFSNGQPSYTLLDRHTAIDLQTHTQTDDYIQNLKGGKRQVEVEDSETHSEMEMSRHRKRETATILQPTYSNLDPLTEQICRQAKEV